MTENNGYVIICEENNGNVNVRSGNESQFVSYNNQLELTRENSKRIIYSKSGMTFDEQMEHIDKLLGFSSKSLSEVSGQLEKILNKLRRKK